MNLFNCLVFYFYINFINAKKINVSKPTGILEIDNFNVQKAICDTKNLTINVNCGFKQSDVENIPNRNLGGEINLKSGTYIIHQLFLYSNIILKGKGINKTILKLSDNAKSYYYSPETFSNGQSGFLRSLRENNIIIQDITLDGNKNNQIDYLLYRYDTSYINNDPEIGKRYIKSPHAYGRFSVYTEACNNVSIINVEVKNWQNYGLDPHGKGGSEYQDYSKYCDNILVENCYVHDNDWDGITIDKSKNVIIRNNIIENNGRHGINLVTGTFDTEIYNNVISNNGYYYLGQKDGCGITAQNNQLYDIYNINIFNNVIDGSAYGGVCLNSVTNSEVNNNLISNTENFCIKLNVQSTNFQMLFENFKPEYVRGSATVSKNINVINNECLNNFRGIYIKYGLNNMFSSNSINTNNDFVGYLNIFETEDEATNTFSSSSISGDVTLMVQYLDTNIVPFINHPNPNLSSDPECITGKIDNEVCHMNSCNPAGGSGCTFLCCTNLIREIKWSCDEYAPPCIIQPKIYPIEGVDSSCSNGLLSSNSKYCCEKQCLICGDENCYNNNYMCCTSQIVSLNVSCNNFSSPCLMDN